jgi:hypothetical protein
MSNTRRRKPTPRSAARRKPAAGADFWGRTITDEDPRPVTPTDEPTALVRSLGAPPLPQREAAAEAYFAMVYEKAAALATALAAASNLLPPDEFDD